MLSVLTPTGGRPEAFRVLCHCIRRQTFRDFEWLVIDDCDPALEVPDVHDDIRVIRPEPRWVPGMNTQARNLLVGLEEAHYDRIVVMEDDDWYAPGYLEDADYWLDYDDLAGEMESVYYCLTDSTMRRMGNQRHASLCATAMTGDAVDVFRQTLKGSPRNIDTRFWHGFRGRKRLYPNENRVVGIKGYPGRPGIGVGHQGGGSAAKIEELIDGWDEYQHPI